MSGRNPFLVERLQGLGHDDLRRDVGAGRARRVRSTSARASPTPTAPPRWPTRRSPPSAAGHNQYPPGTGHRGAARRDRRAPAAVLGHRPSTRTREVLVTAGATEAIAAAVLALCEPGDEVLAFEPTYDSLPRRGRDGRRRGSGRSRCEPPDYAASTSTRCAARGHAPHPAASCSTRRTTRPARCSTADELDGDRAALRRARPHRRHRRGLRAPGVRRRARAARDAARAWPSAR